MGRPPARIVRTLRPGALVFVLVLVSPPGPAAWAAVIRVRLNAPGPVHNGTSLDQAFTGVQQAIATAAAEDEIWVAAGFYKELITPKNGTALYGGFAGTETDRAQRAPC